MMEKTDDTTRGPKSPDYSREAAVVRNVIA
jgi:hypothetical protein